MVSRTGVLSLMLGVILVTPVLSKGRTHSSSSHSHTSHQSHSYPSGGYHSSLSGYGGGSNIHHETIHRTESRPAYTTDHRTHSQQASYPASTGLSGNQRTGTYGTNTHNTQYSRNEVHHNTQVHHHYYNPPPHVTYGSVTHPVYAGPPPTYIYQYRESGSRYDTLLTGLALYNLGRMSSHHHDYNNHYYERDHYYNNYNPQTQYRPRYKDEVCKMRIERRNDAIEETRVPCEAMSSFIFEEQQQSQATSDVGKQSIISSITNTVVNVTKTDSNPSTSSNSTSPSSSVVTTTVQNTTTVVDALQAKGPSLQVSPDMKCYMIHIYGGSMKKQWPVDCGLLQTYAQSSFRSAAGRNIPMHLLTLSLFVLIFW